VSKFFVQVQIFKASDTVKVIWECWVDLNDSNQYSTTARTRRMIWNNDTTTFTDNFTVQNSTGIRVQCSAGINLVYRLIAWR
jgi:hypothetical protein